MRGFGDLKTWRNEDEWSNGCMVERANNNLAN
jgi:hypothetical protein